MQSVSCIIPVYDLKSGKNWERFRHLVLSLAEAAKPLIPDHYEIIIVNDDPSQEVNGDISCLLNELGFTGCFMILSNEINLGQAGSRNKGASLAKNEYLHFIDQDDFVNTEFYSAMNCGSEKDIYLAKPQFYLEKEDRLTDSISIATRLMYKNANKLNNLWPLLFSNIVYSPGQVLIRKTKFLLASGFPNLRNKGSDDYGLFFILAMKCKTTVRYLEESVFCYRIHSSQSSRRLDMQNSVNEFFMTIEVRGVRQKILKYIRTSVVCKPFIKIAYTLFFKRAPKLV